MRRQGSCTHKSLSLLLLIERVSDVIHGPLPIRRDHPGVRLEVVLLNLLEDLLLLQLLQAVSDYFLRGGGVPGWADSTALLASEEMFQATEAEVLPKVKLSGDGR